MRKLILMLLILSVQIPVQAQTKRVILEGFIIGPYWNGAAWDTAHFFNL